MKKTGLFYTLFIMVLLTLASSCSERRKYVIGVSQCSEDIWREKLNSELLTSAMLRDDIELRVVSADDNDRRQINQIDSFISQGIDLLIVSPNQMNTVTDAIDRAYDSGIPVILFDRKTDSRKYTAFIGADNVEIGRIMGRYVISRLGGRGRVAEIRGLEGSSPAQERHRGFVEALQSEPGIKFITSTAGDWTECSGKAAMDSIRSSGGADFVFAHNDRMARGAFMALKEAGDSGQTAFAGIDALPGTEGGIRMVSEGRMDASYIYPTRGDLVLTLAIDILEGRKYNRDNYMEAALVTPDNAGVMLMQAEEMQAQRAQLGILNDEVDMYLTRYSHQQTYLLLCIIIIILGGTVAVVLYRTLLVKRRITEKAAEARLDFFTNMSHELRTPLTLIADPIEQTLDGNNLTPRQRGMLSVARRNISVMLRLVNEIMDFRKIQHGKMKLHTSRFCLSDSLRLWTDCFMPIANTRGVSLECRIDSDVNICADRGMIERICYNLLGNAIKFTPEGGSVRVGLSEDSDCLKITVADTGAGIPRDQLPHIFDRFYQARNTVAGGTGIGLAIVSAFVKLHGGSVMVDSEECRGTTFTVVLPPDCGVLPDCEQSIDNAVKEISEGGLTVSDTTDVSPGLSDDFNGEQPTALVVDDNADVRAYISSLFSGHYNVITAANGQEGFETAKLKVPDIIISDVMMPVMDGMEMCRLIKGYTATSHIPVLMLTADAAESRRVEGYNCGADAYITKPFSGNTVLARVHNLLDTRRRLRERYSSDEINDIKPADVDGNFINELRGKIKESMADADFSVETLSADMGLSRVQLYRKVKAITGSTPVELIRTVRLQRADCMLRAGGKNVSEVAYAVGFSSPSYFSKCYKEHFGKLPTE